MKIGIIGYYGHNNLGDELNLYYILSNLERQYPRAEITVFSGALAKTVADVPYSLVLADYLGREGYVKTLNQQDVLLLGGGGLIFLGAYYWDFMDHGVNTPYVICRMGIDDTIVSQEVVNNYQRLFDRARDVTVRTPGDERLFKQYFIGLVKSVPEPIWQHNAKSDSRNALAVNLTPHCEAFANKISPALQNLDLSIDLLACHFNPAAKRDDASVLRKLDVKARQLFSLSIKERAAVLQNARFVIAARLHACQCAVRALVPTLAIAYRPKVRFLMEQVGMAEYVLNINQVPSMLPERLETLLSNEMKLRNQLEPMVRELVEESKQPLL